MLCVLKRSPLRDITTELKEIKGETDWRPVQRGKQRVRRRRGNEVKLRVMSCRMVEVGEVMRVPGSVKSFTINRYRRGSLEFRKGTRLEYLEIKGSGLFSGFGVSELRRFDEVGLPRQIHTLKVGRSFASKYIIPREVRSLILVANSPCRLEEGSECERLEIGYYIDGEDPVSDIWIQESVKCLKVGVVCRGSVLRVPVTVERLEIKEINGKVEVSGDGSLSSVKIGWRSEFRGRSLDQLLGGVFRIKGLQVVNDGA